MLCFHQLLKNSSKIIINKSLLTNAENISEQKKDPRSKTGRGFLISEQLHTAPETYSEQKTDPRSILVEDLFIRKLKKTRKNILILNEKRSNENFFTRRIFCYFWSHALGGNRTHASSSGGLRPIHWTTSAIRENHCANFSTSSNFSKDKIFKCESSFRTLYIVSTRF